LGTSLALCCEESKISALNELQIASRFEIVRNELIHNITIDVIELGIKPQDFFSQHPESRIKRFNRQTLVNRDSLVDRPALSDDSMKSSYVLWYPLIAAASYMRVQKSDPFAAEYIIPQLLMQWVRKEYAREKLTGIRYFSCASERASELGFNYAFPVSGVRYKNDTEFCDVLARSFRMIEPQFLHEYTSIEECEWHLTRSRNIDYIL